VVELLLCKWEALSSNPSATKQNKKPKTTNKPNKETLKKRKLARWGERKIL
jgi:hypothetical protein